MYEDAVDLFVTFPTKYPTEPLTIKIPKDQELPHELSTHLEEAIANHLLSTERAPEELMFQPFLKWLEENIVSVLREVPSSVENENEGEQENTDSQSSDDDEEDEDENEDVSPHPSDDGTEMSILHALPAKRGTEIRLYGLQFSSAVGTVAVPSAKLVVGCTRCKTQSDVTISAERYV